MPGGNYCARGGINRRVTSRNVQRAGTRAEIAGPFRPRRQRSARRVRKLADILPLLASEKEELVFLDRPVEVPAEIVETQIRSDGREETARVELVVAKEFKSAAVKRVAPAARDDVDRSPGIAAILG